MSSETLKHSVRDRIISNSIIPNALRVGTAAAVITAGSLLPFSTQETLAAEPPQPNQSDKISHFLDNDETKIALVFGLLGTTATIAGAYQLANKYDDKKARLIRMGGPIFAAATTGSLLVDSMTTIPSEIPAGTLVGTALMFAAHNILMTFEHETNIKIKVAAIATATSLVSASIAAFVALSDKI